MQHLLFESPTQNFIRAYFLFYRVLFLK